MSVTDSVFFIFFTCNILSVTSAVSFLPLSSYHIMTSVLTTEELMSQCRQGRKFDALTTDDNYSIQCSLRGQVCFISNRCAPATLTNFFFYLDFDQFLTVGNGNCKVAFRKLQSHSPKTVEPLRETVKKSLTFLKLLTEATKIESQVRKTSNIVKNWLRSCNTRASKICKSRL